MIPCPNCQKSVDVQDKHWGTLFTCPHCNAVYFIDWSGQPELASHEPDAEEEVPAPFDGTYETDFQSGASDFQSGTDFQVGGFQGDFASAGDTFSTPTSHHNFEGTIPESVPDEYAPPEDPILDSAEEIPEGSEFVEFTPPTTPIESPSGFVPEDQYSPSPHSTEGAVENDYGSTIEPVEQPYDFSSTLDTQPAENPLADTSDFSDVASFANSDVSTGPLSYTVIIEGLENSLLVKELREAMSDSKFGWDVEGILSSLSHGRLVIKDVNPSKAFVFISRIKYLPLKITWRQNVL